MGNHGERDPERKRSAVKLGSPSVSQDAKVEASFLWPGINMPLVLSPGSQSVSLTAWAGDNREWIGQKLLQHGALLFRGGDLGSQADFDAFIPILWGETMTYMEGATPRTRLSERVYTSTEFAPPHTIAPHNELSYVTTFPMKIAFFCLTPAESGGETPIADVRKVYERIPKAVRDQFVEKGWMLSRNFGDGFGPTWQSSFHLADQSEAERYFRRADIQFEWKPRGRLRTKQVRPAITRHPRTGESVWFNHIVFWHASSLDAQLRELLLEEFDESGLPYNTFYGDGSRIESEVVEIIRDAIRQESVAFRWQAGDLLLLDNMLVAHGRNPYTGARRVLASMGEPYLRTDT